MYMYIYIYSKPPYYTEVRVHSSEQGIEKAPYKIKIL